MAVNRHRVPVAPWAAVAAGVIALLGSLSLVPARAAPSPSEAYTTTEQYIRSFDGTLLHAYVFRPAGVPAAHRTPVIVEFTPYDNTGGNVAGTPSPTNDAAAAPDTDDPNGLVLAGMFARGYTYVEVADRGTGGSGGCFDVWGPDSQQDTKTVIEWAASQRWSDGKVVIWGESAGAESALDAIAMHPKGLVAAVLVQAPDPSDEVWTNGIRNTAAGTIWGPTWLIDQLEPPSLFSSGEYWYNSQVDHTRPGCPAIQAVAVYSQPTSPYWLARDWVLDADRGSSLPIVYLGGFMDFNAKEEASIALFNSFTGPHRAFFGPWIHIGPQVDNGEPTIGSVALAWFDHFARGKPLAPSPPVLVQGVDGKWRAEQAWPPPDATPSSLELHAGSYALTAGNNEETQLPSALSGEVTGNVPGSGPILADVPLPTGKGAWTFTQPLPYDVRFAGFPTLSADVQETVPADDLVALIYDINPDGAATFVDRGAELLTQSGHVSFQMMPEDWRFEAGDRIGILLTGDDDLWYEPRDQAPVTVVGGSLSIPALRCLRETFLTAPTLNFIPRPVPAPFVVPSATLAADAIHMPLPPAMKAC